MTRGSTPTYTISFEEEIDFDTVKTWSVAFEQGRNQLRLDSPEIDPEEKTLTVTLSQADTLRFADGEAKLQVRGVFYDDVAFVSDIVVVPVHPVIDERILK